MTSRSIGSAMIGPTALLVLLFLMTGTMMSSPRSKPAIGTDRSDAMANEMASIGFDSQKEIPRGTIIPAVSCAKDASQSYALYLPSNYTAVRSWPILYAFDPGARAQL